jgi:diguanylate cyclase (GGDEF)-like protein/PAS domain S-box-containing protein
MAETVRVMATSRHAGGSLADTRRDERWFSALVANSSDIITVLDAEGLVKYSSPAAMHVFGYPSGFMMGRSAFELLHPDDLERVQTQFLAELTTPGPGRPIEFRMRAADDSWRYVEAIGSNLLDDPDVEGIVINTRDVSDRKAAETALQESEERYRLLVEHTPDAIAVHCDGLVVYINPAGCMLLGAADPSEVVGRELARFVHPENRDRVEKQLRSNHDIVPLRAERIVRIDGSVIDVEAVTIPTSFRGRPAAQIVARDVTDQRRDEAELARRALHDPLTGIANRELLHDRLDSAVVRAQRREGCVTLLFIDLDNFKQINDRFGHAVGDRLLIEVAQRFAAATRDGDTLARYGGDEFLVLCEDVDDDDEMRVLAARLLATLDPPFIVNGEDVPISASVGTARSTYLRPDELIHAADRDMYRAKEQLRAE